MSRYQPIHEVQDESRLASMRAALARGETLPPIVVCGDVALSGTHRLAAWDAEGVEPVAVEVTDDEYRDAVTVIGLDPDWDDVRDYDELVDALRDVTDLGSAK